MEKIKEYFQYYLDCFTKNYLNFSGRADRSEFWSFVIFNLIISGILSAIWPWLGGIYGLVALVPSIAVAVRRMADIGRGWVWVLINLIPVIGNIWFIILAVQKSK